MKILLWYCKELNNFATNFNNFFIIQVLSYKNNPYKYFNSEEIRSSVVKTVITDINGDELKLYDLEDDLTTTMDLSQVTHNVHWFLL